MLSGMHDFSANQLNPTQPTLASVLKEQGYATGAVVASAVLDSRFGLNRGFDFYYDHFDFSRLQESNIEEMERPGNVVADLALDWLSKNYQKKFFLWMHLYDPHYPYHPPPRIARSTKTIHMTAKSLSPTPKLAACLHSSRKRGSTKIL